MDAGVPQSAFIHDAFISYSRKDREFSARLEQALENYKPPKNLKVPQRHLDIFRDEGDFTGVDYHQAIDRHLRNSRKLIVVCSPNARNSSYVNDEIRRFVSANGPGNIIPILLSGIPNNAAKPRQEGDMAFPAALCEAMQMPLATSYRDFDARREKVNKGVYYGAWYALLANLYDVTRSEIEQRDKQKQTRTRRITIAIVGSVMALLSAALVVTVISRNEAVRQQNIADEQRGIAVQKQQEAERAASAEKTAKEEALAAAEAERRAKEEEEKQRQIAEDRRREAELQSRISRSRELAASAVSQLPADSELSALLAREALQVIHTQEAENALRQSLPDVYIRSVLRGHTDIVTSLAYSPDGKFLVTAGADKTARVWEASGKMIATLAGHLHEPQS